MSNITINNNNNNGSCYARALYDFHGESSEDLYFLQGDIILVQSKNEISGWWTGKFICSASSKSGSSNINSSSSTRQGIFPGE